MKVKSDIESKVPEYAAILRQCRENKKMKQTDVAKELGVSAMGLSHYETGVRAPNVQRLDKWAQIVGMEMTLTLKEI